MSVFEKIENALKLLNSTTLANRVIPVAAAALIGVTAGACYAAPPQRSDPYRMETPDQQVDSAPPAEGSKAGEPLQPGAAEQPEGKTSPTL
ncbi:MAG: hypothetical protein CVU65_10615 [Deltaproteobacteria bacterium HGW-Deltaproteobacteria-22]|jgi:hypothetical protein|nr:MAG: hypothetical protein CVU65_10615 [Deltaproteobacteria bacterium HGW-Deltaproteobacteria-22]